MNTEKQIIDFVTESNRIEGIIRDPYQSEIDELVRFMGLDIITIEELEKFVSVYQPNAKLRIHYNMNVRIGSYYPPRGGPNIIKLVKELLEENYDSYDLHIKYELIHPFTDCNGRSGRALWAWKFKHLSQGFLHRFYYHTLKKIGDQSCEHRKDKKNV